MKCLQILCLITFKELNEKLPTLFHVKLKLSYPDHGFVHILFENLIKKNVPSKTKLLKNLQHSAQQWYSFLIAQAFFPKRAHDQKKWTKSTSFCVRRRIQTVFFSAPSLKCSLFSQVNTKPAPKKSRKEGWKIMKRSVRLQSAAESINAKLCVWTWATSSPPSRP